MTLVEHDPREQQHPQPDQRGTEQSQVGRVDLARTDAHRVATLVQIARDGHNEARDSGDDAERLRNASDVLYARVASKPGDRLARLDRALHGIDGSLDEQAVLEYLDLTGRQGFTARKALQQILDLRTLPEFEGGLEISDRLHGLAHSWERDARVHEAGAEVRPALPSAAAPTPEPLPHREPIAPALPPLFPPAPEPTPAETTSHLVERVIESRRDNGQPVVAAEAAAAARLAKRPAAAPDMGPAPDPGFVASALPGRFGDTVTMRTEDVLAHLEAADASTGDAPGPRPFAKAASAAESPRSVAAARDARGDDDAES